MPCLFYYPQVIKHNCFIKTGEGLWPVATEALAQVILIRWSPTTVIPHYHTLQ